VLDEPTNHLDVESIEALEDAVEDYQGTVILVSHDRAFLRELATRVWAFDGDRIEDFGGPFVEWESLASERAAKRNAAQNARDAVARNTTRAAAKKAADTKKDGDGGARSAKRTAEQSEEKGRLLEIRISELEHQLADPTLYSGGAEGARRAAQIDRDLRAAIKERDAALATWAAAAEELERLGKG
jgi:ATP-binding cassette subfamily F protein 3